MRFAVIQFGGTNCDYDTRHAIRDICGIECDLIWYKEKLGEKYDAIILPGGFSYGDYLRAGGIAARTPIMQEVVSLAGKGKLVLGICNGAQILAESGLVPGVFTVNAYPKFICRPQLLRVENTDSPFTTRFSTGEVIRIPIAHHDGRYVAPEGELEHITRERFVAFRYCDPIGNLSPDSNPNGSEEHIAGLLGSDRNVLAMMPHPERASEELLGSEDGKRIFLSMADWIGEHA